MANLNKIAICGTAFLLLATCSVAQGNAPAGKAQRESEAMTEQIKQGDNDKERWSRVSLYSDSEEPEDLAMTVVKSVGLAMKLDPTHGQLAFTSKGSKQVFAIATTVDDKRTVCPKYNVRVIDASAKHAVLRRVCNEYEFRPNRFVASVDYFIYDADTSTMRSIWHNEVTKKGSPLPVAKPVPMVRVLPNGYQFDWQAQNLNNISEGPTEIHTTYLRKNVEGARSLICTDNAAPKGEGLEAGYCEGERPPVITK
ncbi:hypothetical protein GM658_07840 [Pseudoduganella eburnea]|uniref:Lipoprotein n=1 Tax=Massilia eburnea TaxID=1776165 RepID=A0A6L6QEM6_9BURK|nr:hypothetical protein [Massilia eburnea]MTW10514.1 hypothetical protein [Massilia eburnea]